ncbi:hypothetical protein GN958_ATG04689 [Phytophthora infestans]|uniref:Uncharacterized protein n=1 Tax=Phytophthora infestans TaxID=4787 RepID=A0A8S9UIW6_PHYIN|nr:hypothetical protein GN958_ATG09783 [Phytophthora infestans]KAF4146214.1 hypothetical protein GN958_ATG04689 [Phytophthora infestans]
MFFIRLQNVLTLEHLPVELWCVHELIESDDIAAIIPAIRVINIDAAGATWVDFLFARATTAIESWRRSLIVGARARHTTLPYTLILVGQASDAGWSPRHPRDYSSESG